MSPLGNTDNAVNPCQPLTQKIHRALHRAAIAELLQLGGDMITQFPGITLPAQIDHAGIEPPVTVSPHEQAEVVTVAQGTDTHTDAVELLFAALEQFVSG